MFPFRYDHRNSVQHTIIILLYRVNPLFRGLTGCGSPPSLPARPRGVLREGWGCCVCVPGTTQWTRTRCMPDHLVHHPPSVFVPGWRAQGRVVVVMASLSASWYRSASHLTALPRPTHQPGGLPGALPAQRLGNPHLEACFPLRCFQRLSLPNVANQPCSWRNNWHTRG